MMIAKIRRMGPAVAYISRIRCAEKNPLRPQDLDELERGSWIRRPADHWIYTAKKLLLREPDEHTLPEHLFQRITGQLTELGDKLKMPAKSPALQEFAAAIRVGQNRLLDDARLERLELLLENADDYLWRLEAEIERRRNAKSDEQAGQFLVTLADLEFLSQIPKGSLARRTPTKPAPVIQAAGPTPAKYEYLSAKHWIETDFQGRHAALPGETSAARNLLSKSQG